MTARENGTSGAALVERALAALLACAMAAAYCLPAEALAEALEESGPTDIAAEWAAGALTISEAGSYTLSADVETDGALTVLAGEGEEIELDLAGHSVTIEGDVFCGVDVSGSLGSVSIVDSAYDAADEGAEKASLTVVAEGVEEDAAGVLARYVELGGVDEDGDDVAVPSLAVEGVSVSVSVVGVKEGTAGEEHDAYAVYVGYADEDDPRSELDVALRDVELFAQVTVAGAEAGVADGCEALSEEGVGVAYGVYANAVGVSLDGLVSCEAVSDNLDCGLYSTVEGAFELGADFELDGETRVYAGGNAAGTLLATVDEELDVDDSLLGLLVDGSGAGNALELSEDGGALVFAEAADAGDEGGDDVADGVEDAEGAATISSVIEGLLEGAVAEGAGEDASETISSALAALSAAAEDDAEDAGGSALSTLSEGSTWTVTDASGATVGSYSSFDDAESALTDGGTVTLNEDLGATYASNGTVSDASTSTAIAFDGKSSGSYTIDLAGHMLGEVKFTCAADLTITSSVDGGGLDGASTNYGVYASSSGALTVKDVEITNACAGSLTNYYGVYLYKASSASLEGVDVKAEALGGTQSAKGAYGLYALSCASLELEDCDLSASTTDSSTNGYAYGVSLSSSTATFENCKLSATRAGSVIAYGIYVGASSSATVTGGSLSATSESGTAYGAYAIKTLKASGASFSASSEGGSGYALGSGSSASVSLGAGCSFEAGAAAISSRAPISLLSGFSTSETLAVYNASSLSGAVFASYADDLDGEELAAKFTPSDASYYAGYEASASDGSLMWVNDADAEEVDLYGLLTDDGVALSSDVSLDYGKNYYLSQSVNGYSGQIKMTGDGTYDIDLRGNTITFGSGGFYIYAKDGGTDSVNIYSTDGNGTAKQGYIEEGYIYCSGTSGYSALTLKNIDLSIAKNVVTSYSGYMPISVGSYAKSLTVSSCNIDVDYSDSSSSSNANVIGVRVNSSSMSSISFVDTTVDVTSESPYDAIAVYVNTTSCAASIDSCTFNAASTQGSAIAFYNDKYWSYANARITFSGSTALSATGANGQVSLGIVNVQGQVGGSNSTSISETAGRPVTLNGPVSFSTEATSAAAALASDEQYSDSSTAPFVLSSSFSASEKLPVALGLEVDTSRASGTTDTRRPCGFSGISEDANASGSYIATFDSSVSSSSYEAMLAAFSSANSLVSTEPALADDGVLFASVNAVCAAHIVRDGETLEYESLALATAAAADGEMVVVDLDLDAATIAESSSASSGSIAYTVDLAGHDAAMITCESSQDVMLTNSSEDSSSTVTGYEDGNAYGIVQVGSGTLALEGIDVDVQNVSGTTNFAVRATSGMVALRGCTVAVDALSGAAYALALAGGGATASATTLSAETASTGSAAVAAGVYMSSSSSTVALEGCTVSASGSPGVVAGAYLMYGSLSASTGSDGTATTLFAEASSSSGSAYGVYVAETAAASLDGCSLSASAAEGSSGAAWCVYATGSTTSTGTWSASVTLAGETAFSSSADTHVRHAIGTLQISDSFAVSGGGTVTVQSVSLADGDVFAEPADEGGDLSGLVDSFEPTETSDNVYLGWHAEANDDGSLSWTNDDVAVIGEDSYYKSLARALAEADEGATVTMIGDSTEAALTVTRDVTVDLAGHTVSVLASSTATAVNVSAGRLTLEDSSEEDKGCLSLRLSYMSGTSKDYVAEDATLAAKNVGLYADSGAGVTLSDAAVQVTYSNSTNTAVAVTGAYAVSGAADDGEPAILLQEGSALSVDAGSAMKAYGAYVGQTSGAQAESIEIDEGASVEVSNGNDFLTRSYTNPTLGSTIGSTVWLKLLEVDHASDLWAEICEAFLYYAEFSSTYDTYTMSAVTLTDGTMVWAYSDVLEEEQVGVEEYIVPSTVYVMSDAQASPDAIGVGDYGDSGSTIVVEGSVSATSANGNAYALRTSAASTWQVDGATLSATTYGTGTYLRISQYGPVLMGNTTQGNVTYRLVESVEVEAACVSRGEVELTRYNNGVSGPAVELSGEVSMAASAVGGLTSEVMLDQVDLADDFAAEEGSIAVSDDDGETSWGDVFAVSADSQTQITSGQQAAFVDSGGTFEAVLADDALSLSWDYGTAAAHATVTFTAARDSDGAKLDDVEVTADVGVAFGTDNAALAPAAEDYGTYRFVGWQESSSGDVIDPECLFARTFDEDTTLTAKYVTVNASSQLVVFKVDDLLYAAAVSSGGTVTWKQVSGSSSAPSRASSGTWEFAGWYEGYYGEYTALTEDDVDYGPDDALPAAETDSGEDAWYTAVFEGDGTAVSTVTLHYYSDWDGSGSWDYGSGSFTLADGTDVSSDESVTSGSYLVSGVALDCVTQASDGTWEAHEFLGWSVRESDVAPLSNLPAVGEGVTEYYAIYDTHDMDVEVTFYGEDESCTVTAGSADSVADAMAADGYALDAPAGKQLAGWAYEEGATTTSFTNGAFVYLWDSGNFAAPDNGSGDITGTASFYAVWETADPVSVVLHVNGGMWSSASADDYETTATPGIAIEWESYSAPYKYGCWFLEWNDAEDGSGDAFDVSSDAVPEDGLELWAQYADISIGEVADGADLDVSAALVRTRAAVGADSVSVSLTECSSADGNLSVSSSYYSTLSRYRLSVKIVYDEGTAYESSSELTEGFGEIYVSMPVEEAYAERDLYAFTLDTDGTTAKTACALQTSLSDGSALAVYSLSSYASSTAANVVLAYALTDEEITLATAISQAMAQLNEYYATFDSDDYTGDDSSGNWGTLVSYYEGGLAAIAAATSVEEVAEAYETAANGMAGVETSAGLAQAQAEALEELAEAYATYSAEDYSTKNWKKLVAAYEAAKEAIKAAESTSDAYSAASAGIIAMAKVKVASGSSSSSLLSSSSSSSSSSSTLASSSGSSSSSTLSSSSSTLSSYSSSSLSGSGSASASGLASTASNAMSMLEGEFLTVTETVADAFALKASSGVVVLTVEEDGAMDAAGFKVGDVIVAVDGNAITTLDELEDYLSGLSAGDTVTFTVNRGGEEVELTVTLSAVADDASATQADYDSDTDSDDSSSEGSEGLSETAKWIGEHIGLVTGIVIGIILLVLLIAGILIGLMLRKRKQDEDEEQEITGEDGFWDEGSE